MSTQKRKDSSRANGAKSRGPVTPEGRARSRAASLTHGFASDLVVLSYESGDEFNALREAYLADYQPQNRSQVDLVDHLVATRWRLNRVLALQSALMEVQMLRQEPEIDKEFEGCGGDVCAAIAYQHLCDDSRALESLNRHETRLSAELRRTIKLLNAPPKNQKLHHGPSDAQPPHSDEDMDAAEPPPSTIDPPPSTTSDDPPSSSSEDPAGEALRIPPATEHLPSTIDYPPSTRSDERAKL